MIVLDCSAGVATVLGSAEGKALKELVLTEEKIISPSLYIAETTHVFEKYVKAGIIEKYNALERERLAIGIVDDFIEMKSFYTEVLTESVRLKHSSYDLFYFLLAKRTGSTLFTLDKRLSELCLNNGVECVCEVKA